MTYAVRPPRPSDAPALGRLHTRIWRETYGHLMTPEALAALDDGRATARWEQWIAAADEEGFLPRGGRVLVGVDADDVPVGFIIAGPPRDEDPPVDWQLSALNVLPEHHGTGLAQRLLAEGLGDRAAYLWVARGNERAIRFYRKHGFELDGAEQRDEEGITELRMVRGEQRAH
jgi:ribosomal protein S18 acetylase RimI-like enzyme